MRNKLLGIVEDMKDEISDLTAELVKIPTVNPPGQNYVKCAKYIGDILEKTGIDVDLISVPKEELDKYGLELPRTIVLGKWSGSEGSPTLHINGHYDVVAAGAGWTVDPFGGVVDGDKLYGRGSSDMKSGLACMIMAVSALKRTEAKLKGDLFLSFVPDEETGGMAGAEYLVREGYGKADMAIITEPGGPVKPSTAVTLGHKGALWLRIKTFGKSSHGSLPSKGVNAVEKMAKVILGLQQLRAKHKEVVSRHPITPLEGKNPTINIGGIIKGGTKINTVPDSCMITVDRRLIPEEDPSDARKEIEEILKRIKTEDPDLETDIETVLIADPAITSIDEKLVQVVAGNVRQILKAEPIIRVTMGFQDTRFFANQMRIPAISYGPGVSTRAHSPNEYVSISDMVSATKILATSITDLLGTS